MAGEPGQISCSVTCETNLKAFLTARYCLGLIDGQMSVFKRSASPPSKRSLNLSMASCMPWASATDTPPPPGWERDSFGLADSGAGRKLRATLVAFGSSETVAALVKGQEPRTMPMTSPKMVHFISEVPPLALSTFRETLFKSRLPCALPVRSGDTWLPVVALPVARDE